MVTVYTKPDCVQCRFTIQSLKSKNIHHEVIDVTQDDTAFDHVIELGYRQMPVVESQTGHWAGFQPEMLKQLDAGMI